MCKLINNWLKHFRRRKNNTSYISNLIDLAEDEEDCFEKISKDVFFKYKKYDLHAKDSLEKKYFYFSKPSELDDPFECKAIPYFDNASDEEIQFWLDKMKTCGAKIPYNNVADVKNDIKNGKLTEYYLHNSANAETHRVFSLCKECDNETLWAAYADYYNGLCIGYKTRFSPEKDENYYALDIRQPSADVYGVVFNDSNSPYLMLKKVDYSGRYKFDWISHKLYNQNGSLMLDGSSSLDDENKIYNSIFRSKNPVWEKQNEYRCTFQVLNKDLKKIEYPDETLSTIIFGYKMTPDKIKEVYDTVTKQYKSTVDFYIAVPDIKTLKIKIIKYSPDLYKKD